MKAHARVIAERGRERSRCTTLHSEPPLTFRSTPDGLHLVGTAAGPLGGDELTLELTVAAGASLTVRSVAAQLVMPSPWPAPSTMRSAIEVAAGATLRWLPEPILVVRGADHRATVTIDLAPDAGLQWREEVVLGRDGEPGGSLLQRLRVDRAGRPLLCTEVALGPAWPASSGPAGTGGARVMATTLLVGEPARPALDRLGQDNAVAVRIDNGAAQQSGVRWASYRLPSDSVLLMGLGGRLDAVRAALVIAGSPDR